MPLPTSSIALLLLALCLGTGCAQGTRLDPVRIGPCACQGATCPPSVCDLQIEVSKVTCGGHVQQVEVLLGEQLEADVYLPGVPRRTCATIPRGQTLRMSARADSNWQWIEDIHCPGTLDGDSVGPTLQRILDCTEPSKGVDATPTGDAATD